jgi:hypothetical protein
MPAGSSADAVESENQSRETTRWQARTSAIPKRRATTTETGVPLKRLHQLDSLSENEDAGVQIGASDVVHNSASLANGLWAKPGEIEFYAKAPAIPWPGCVPLFGRLSELERSEVIAERSRILAHLRDEESKRNSDFQSHWRLLAVDKEFTRWEKAGC